jgi:hypothetical protein
LVVVPGITTYVVPSNEYSHLATVSPPEYPIEKLKEAFVTTPLDELQLELAPELVTEATEGTAWANNVKMLINTVKSRKGYFLDFCS